jgi:hypothetical protein
MRAVLHRDVDRDAIDDAALRLHWQLINVISAARERPAQLIFAARGGYVHFVFDDKLGVRYLQTEATTVLEAARAELRCYRADEYLSLCEMHDDADAVQLGLALAVLHTHADAPDDAAVEALGRALRSSDRAMRAAAFVAASYAPWRELCPHIEAMRDADPDFELRRGAAQWLDMVRQP